MRRVDHIPAISGMCHRLGIIDLINESIPCNTDIDLGTLVVGMICDTLSGRIRLYQVEDFITEQDTELLFGAYGHSKDKRGDLKQFMVSMLCVEGNIPLSGKMQDGNASDNKLNNEELQRISKLMRPLKNNISEMLYVADCKAITPDNIPHLRQLLFVSRFPATYKEHDLAIDRALESEDWDDLGILAETPSPSKKHPRASYRVYETTVTLEEESYRALVVQTDQFPNHLLHKRRRAFQALSLHSPESEMPLSLPHVFITFHQMRCMQLCSSPPKSND